MKHDAAPPPETVTNVPAQDALAALSLTLTRARALCLCIPGQIPGPDMPRNELLDHAARAAAMAGLAYEILTFAEEETDRLDRALVRRMPQ